MEWNGSISLTGPNNVCVSERACVWVTAQEDMCVSVCIFLWNVYQCRERLYKSAICVLHACVCVFSSEHVRRCLRYEASSPPRPPYGHLETLICAVCVRVCVSACAQCVCVCVSVCMCACVFVCLAGHEQCADDVKSPWVAFRRSPARSGNHPVYGPYVKTAQKRAHASSEDLTHKHTLSLRHIFAILTYTLVSN